MWTITSIVTLSVLLVHFPYKTTSYNTYRSHCSYYDNPIFAIEIEDDEYPKFQSRIGGGSFVALQPPTAEYPTSNHLKKERYKYQTNQQLKPNIPKVGYYLAPAPSVEIYQQSEEDETVIPNFDSDQFWHVGDEPKEERGLYTLPDIFIPGEEEQPEEVVQQEREQQEDAPPISDIMSVEKSELTEETHDLEDVEIQEKYLKDPSMEPEEVIVEKITNRTDNEKKTKTKEEVKVQEKIVKHNKEDIKEEKKDFKQSPIMKIKKVEENERNTTEIKLEIEKKVDKDDEGKEEKLSKKKRSLFVKF